MAAYWANERTLLAWLAVAIFLSVSAVQLLTVGDRGAIVAGTVMAPIAMLVAVYSLVRFHLRNVAIHRSDSQDAQVSGGVVVDWFGPWIAVPLVCIMLVMLTIISFLFGAA